jgi:hypothetical protein|nr:MAG TPA: hypothetical protein [Bacteriophage sp.]
MLNITKSISVQGTSMIEENGSKVAVMYLSANKSTCEADYEEFKAEVDKLMLQ